MTQTKERLVDWYLMSFGEFEKTLNGEAQTRLHALRRKAISKFVDLGFPTTKDEEWRFTNVSPITNLRFLPVTEPERSEIRLEELSVVGLPDFDCIRLVYVDGHYASELSLTDGLPAGVTVGSFRSGLKEGNNSLFQSLAHHAGYEREPFTALNTAFLQDGALVHVPRGIVVDRPIHILYVSGRRSRPFLTVPRNLFVIQDGARVSIIESYVGIEENIYFTNAVTEVVVGSGSVVEHDKIQSESVKGFHIGTIHVSQQERSTYTANSVSLGGGLVRNNVIALLDGEHCECTLNGLSLATGTQLIDNHTTIEHAKPKCVSHELYKSILDGASKGVFSGKIFVRKDAQKTDAKQTNKTLLLSDEATIDTKPQLEIFADDVKCTHGATVGQLDEEQIFYLRSRGMGLEQARDVLTYAFAREVTQRVHVEPLRDQLEAMIHAKLHRGRIIQDDRETDE